MFNVHELMEYRMQQQIAQEIYRQQIMQRIPDPFPMLPVHLPPHMIAPPRPTLPGNVEAKLENNDLWQQFHKIGTEMIITKTGRRMFPSMRVTVAGLEEDSQYCVLLEMIPIGECRYKFSGSQWVPAGGAEPQSPQRMFLHPDSPATGAHWQSQAILFNKVKLTNNTLDNSGHIVLASMHKYQPRLHIIKTSDLTQLPWSPQQNYIFPETEFIAVTAYQNDRITKLKIDNNPFAKGFRETGQSKCKRKLMTSSSPSASTHCGEDSDDCQSKSEDDQSSVSSYEATQCKRLRLSDNSDEESGYCSSSSISPRFDKVTRYYREQFAHYGSGGGGTPTSSFYHPQQQQQQQQQQQLAAAAPAAAAASFMHHHHQPLQSMIMESFPYNSAGRPLTLPIPMINGNTTEYTETTTTSLSTEKKESSTTSISKGQSSLADRPSLPTAPAQKRNNFSISAILAY